MCQLSQGFYGGVLDIDVVMPAPRLSESQKEELVARYRQGETAQALAASYGCSPNTVSRVLKAGIDPDELASLKKQSRSRSAAKPSEVEVETPASEPASAHVLDEANPSDDEADEDAGVLAIDDADDFGDDGDDETFDDGDDSAETTAFGAAAAAELIDPIPLLPGLLPSSVYMLVDKAVELQAKPLNEFPELGSLPETEQARQALMLFTNPRQAKRQCGRSQRVIKVPDSDVLQRRSSYLVAQGITRLVVEGGLLYSLPEA
nr:helix-turn-helix domain-containing protein [Synechococcus sp. LTW-R]